MDFWTIGTGAAGSMFAGHAESAARDQVLEGLAVSAVADRHHAIGAVAGITVAASCSVDAMRLPTKLALVAMLVAGCRATLTSGPSAGPPPPPPPGPQAPPPATAPPAQSPLWSSAGWTLLGAKVVNNTKSGVDTDVIYVGKQEGRFDQVTLVVQNSDLELQELTIAFHDATTFKPPLKHTFREGQRTRLIELPYGNRAIDSVTLKYSNLPGGGNAKVEVWAKHR